jgi:hypothetical protein
MILMIWILMVGNRLSFATGDGEEGDGEGGEKES